METVLPDKLLTLTKSIGYLLPELVLTVGILLIIFTGLFKKHKHALTGYLAFMVLLACILQSLVHAPSAESISLLDGMIHVNHFSVAFKTLLDIASLLTVIMSLNHVGLKNNKFTTEYYTFLLSAVLGAHLLTSTTNMVMVFISLELLSISSYVLAGYNQDKKGAEGSLKYFLFGSVASAVMLYGFSVLFGLSGTTDFSSTAFVENLLRNSSPLILVGGLMALAGFLYKVAATPMHPWAPDVYEAAPMPVVAFLSVVPKLAGLAVLAKFTLAINLYGQSDFDWQLILSVVAMLSITIGNFSALWQNNPKRMMAYSAIAQSGFLLIGIVCFTIEGSKFLLFYSGVYLLANFAIFYCLQLFEKNGIESIPAFSGWGKSQVMASVLLLMAFISLAGIPPTGGFTAKLFIFTALWDAYEQTDKQILIWLLVFGLANTVVALYYYLKIPYYAFLKTPGTQTSKKAQTENYFALILVVLILLLFIQPDILMGWLNRINFVL